MRQCINSCLHQSYDDLEIILINDASKDDSLKICQTYCESDTRIRLIENSINEGVEMSRYHGLQSANGEYVMFIDLSNMQKKKMQTTLSLGCKGSLINGD